MDFLKNYAEFVEQEIKNLELPSSPIDLYDPLKYFLAIGGKRIRPILTLMSGELFGLKKEDVINGALAIEFLHNFSLIHDDIMDKAPLRRGFETVHEKWNQDVAILAGDVLMIKAYQCLAKQQGDLKKLMDAFNQSAIEICEGQQFDMEFETKESVSISEYIEMIRLKTSVLLGCALKLGAIAADASKVDSDLIYNFGVNIGISFQIQDDILDLYGNPATFGKQIGGDVLANKKTILFLLALENANEEQKESLLNLQKELDPDRKIQLAKELFDSIDVRGKAVELKNKYSVLANQNLQKIQVETCKKQNLIQLSDYLLVRKD